ncbi:DUF262 domain-containing protein [Aeromonas veronii]|uniref:DUF262 domain-containing protein n=1 Tax=Aeromonas veronii TaxID=654 RepID=UPI0038F01E0D
MMTKSIFDNHDSIIPSLDLVDDEDVSNGEDTPEPWDPSKIRISTKHFSLRDVVTQIMDNEIDLSPDFQRDYVWRKRQQTRLIESILLGIPLPAFYFNQSDDGSYQVIDGVQRLSTISMFMNDRHVLSNEDLEYLQNLDGLLFSQLDVASSRRFRSTQIVVHVIEPQTPEEVKYDIFSRVNTSGSPLSAQEIRHAMSKERSRKLLGELSESISFDEATGFNFWRKDSNGDKIRHSGRMTNRELVLRFLAFRNFSIDEYRKYKNLDAYLVEFTKQIDGKSKINQPISDIELISLKCDFHKAMENARFILDDIAFRRFSLESKRKGPINRAVFESQAIALADYNLADLEPKKNDISHAFRKAFDDDNFVRSVSVGTGSPSAVEYRIKKMRETLKGILHD